MNCQGLFWLTKLIIMILEPLAFVYKALSQVIWIKMNRLLRGKYGKGTQLSLCSPKNPTSLRSCACRQSMSKVRMRQSVPAKPATVVLPPPVAFVGNCSDIGAHHTCFYTGHLLTIQGISWVCWKSDSTANVLTKMSFGVSVWFWLLLPRSFWTPQCFNVMESFRGKKQCITNLHEKVPRWELNVFLLLKAGQIIAKCHSS